MSGELSEKGLLLARSVTGVPISPANTVWSGIDALVSSPGGVRLPKGDSGPPLGGARFPDGDSDSALDSGLGDGDSGPTGSVGGRLGVVNSSSARSSPLDIVGLRDVGSDPVLDTD
jgi:hypothetical protein